MAKAICEPIKTKEVIMEGPEKTPIESESNREKEEREKTEEIAEIRSWIEKGDIRVQERSAEQVIQELVMAEKEKQRGLEKSQVRLMEDMKTAPWTRTVGDNLGPSALTRDQIKGVLAKNHQELSKQKESLARLESGDAQAGIEALQLRLDETLGVISVMKEVIADWQPGHEERMMLFDNLEGWKESLADSQAEAGQYLTDIQVLKAPK